MSHTSSEKHIGAKHASHIEDNLRNIAGEVKADLRDLAHEAGKRSRDFVDQAGEEISDATNSVAGLIRKKPFQSSAIALGVGVLVGMFFRRR